jgi:hypothetical protein
LKKSERIARNNKLIAKFEKNKYIYPHEIEAIKEWITRMEYAPTNEKIIYSEALNVLIKSIIQRETDRKNK